MKKLINKPIESICSFISDSINFILFILDLIRYSAYRNPISKDCKGTIAVLANGPSLKDTIIRIEKDDEFKNVDYIVLNYFAHENIFTKIKPKYYCFADPMFFIKTHREAEAKELFRILKDKVNWSMHIFVPNNLKNHFIKFSGLKDSQYIKIIGVNNIQYKGFKSLKNYFFKKGLAIPEISTVAILAIYASLNKGYEKLNLYGVDHSFFDGLCVNENNQVCNVEKHFYDNKKSILKPIIRNDNNEIWKISQYLQSITNMFSSHDILALYADYLGVEIVNCTHNSMIDSYKRK